MFKKFCVIMVLLSVSALANANTTLSLGYGKEKINNNFDVNLYAAKISHSIKNNYTLSYKIQKGYPKINKIPNEERQQVSIGYSKPINRLIPYSIIGYGKRDIKNINTYDYYLYKLGTKAILPHNFFGNIEYRYRNTNQSDWKSETYSVALGSKLTNKTSLVVQYGYTTGSYRSNSTSIFIVTRL